MEQTDAWRPTDVLGRVIGTADGEDDESNQDNRYDEVQTEGFGDSEKWMLINTTLLQKKNDVKRTKTLIRCIKIVERDNLCLLSNEVWQWEDSVHWQMVRGIEIALHGGVLYSDTSLRWSSMFIARTNQVVSQVAFSFTSVLTVVQVQQTSVCHTISSASCIRERIQWDSQVYWQVLFALNALEIDVCMDMLPTLSWANPKTKSVSSWLGKRKCRQVLQNSWSSRSGKYWKLEKGGMPHRKPSTKRQLRVISVKTRENDSQVLFPVREWKSLFIPLKQ